MAKIRQKQINAGGMVPEGILGEILKLLGAGQKSLDPSSMINPIGAMAKIPFQSMRRLPQVQGFKSAKILAADARQARMDQMGSAYDFLIEQMDSSLDNFDEAVKMKPERTAKLLAEDFNLDLEDGVKVVDEFLKYAKKTFGE